MRFKIVLALAVVLSCAPAWAAQQHQAHRDTAAAGGGRLGHVNFPVSCSTAAQKSFNTAVALLHSFQYEASERTFVEVAERDPQCAMAYWGQALALYEQLWDWPDAGTLKKGREYIAKAQRLGAKTQREREYIAAVAVFYQDRPKLDRPARSGAYSKAMGEIYSHYPDDGEAAAFYALSLIVLPAHGPEETANRRKAIGVLEKLFAAQPNHPGAAHYLIHAADTPELAPEGLAAARSYAKIAPDSAHALHMPSHIFTRLGLWQESIESNLASADAAAKATEAHVEGGHYQLHAMDFLSYAYLQSGQEAKARRVIEDLQSVPGADAESLATDRASWTSRCVLELHRWKDAAALEPPAKGVHDQAFTYSVRTIGAARLGDAALARKNLAKFKERYAAAKAEDEKEHRGYGGVSHHTIAEQETEAWVLLAEGKRDEAVKLMRAAADAEDAEGVDSLSMPAREMLGDLLLELHQAAEALAAYQDALKKSPDRFDGLYGAARAAQMAGDAEQARDYYAKLMRICAPGADRPELEEARVYLAKK